MNSLSFSDTVSLVHEEVLIGAFFVTVNAFIAYVVMAMLH